MLTKIKMILPLLLKLAGPVLSMLISVLSYAFLLGRMETAIGLVIMLFIHEMGHVFAAKQKKLPVSLPVFIPFLGALITMKKHPRDAVTEAYIAFGGPLLGSIGALAALLIGVWLDQMLLVAIAYIGFFLNLINLLPIHPLDGGRISVAVTRWLWLFGLIGGFFVILYLKSILFFIVWLWFAWDLYKKYIRNKKSGTALTLPFQMEISGDYLVERGSFIPGEQHRSELSFVTYSTLEGNQKVEVFWESLGVRHTVNLPYQMILHGVKMSHIEHIPNWRPIPEKIVVHCQISGEMYVSDQYYEVPNSTRWKFGLAYAGLALFLFLMIGYIHRIFPMA